MPTKQIDRTGLRFGRWTIESFHGRDKSRQALWTCRCDCGTRRPVIYNSLASGRSTSCGCAASSLRGAKHRKHGMAGTPTYKSWHQMHQRCQGLHGRDYYVRKGITVCERWSSFESFFADMGARPPGMTLDRIDGSLGYEPANCRWATRVEQANNRVTNIRHLVFGEPMTASQAASKYGKGISCVRHRLRRGMSLQDAVSIPSRRAPCVGRPNQTIKPRKGTLLPNGIFQKEE